jgi:DNA-binding XRE family transcriptional regulator
MGTQQRVMQPWDSAAYRNIERVDAEPNGRLTVFFDNHDSIAIDGHRLIRSDTGGLDWEHARDGEFRDTIDVPREGGEAIAIPWDVIRSLSDAEFAAHRAQQAQQQAREIGARLRALREARGLQAKEVASRAGITAQSIYRIEHGKHHVVLSTVGRILAAMAYSYRDLIAVVGDDGQDDERAAVAHGR